MQIGASKIQAYLENRGESEGKQPYLHKFYIPLLMVGVFFIQSKAWDLSLALKLMQGLISMNLPLAKYRHRGTPTMVD